MTGPMSEAALQAGLRDIRLPAEAPGDLAAEAAAALALALFAALLMSGALRLWTRAAAAPHDPHDVESLRHLPADRRRVALLHQLKARSPERFAALRGALYRPGGLGLADIEAAMSRDD